MYRHGLDIQICFDGQATASSELYCSATHVGMYHLYKLFIVLLSGVWRNIVIMKKEVMLLVTMSTNHLKVKGRALTGEKPFPNVSLPAAQFTHIEPWKPRSFRSCSGQQLVYSHSSSGCSSRRRRVGRRKQQCLVSKDHRGLLSR